MWGEDRGYTATECCFIRHRDHLLSNILALWSLQTLGSRLHGKTPKPVFLQHISSFPLDLAYRPHTWTEREFIVYRDSSHSLHVFQSSNHSLYAAGTGWGHRKWLPVLGGQVYNRSTLSKELQEIGTLLGATAQLENDTWTNDYTASV